MAGGHPRHPCGWWPSSFSLQTMTSSSSLRAATWLEEGVTPAFY
jgi:hypothetical protein